MSDDREIVENDIIKLDYSDLRNKVFRKCKLIYQGGRPPTIIDCEFDTCEFIFEGPALNTMNFIASMARGGGGGAELVVNHFIGLKDWGRS